MFDDDATPAIRAYLPRLLIRRIAANADLHLPDETCFAAAVAFVDVSGFTALSTSLADVHGREGGELLQKYINEYFEKMLAIVQAHGGDVVDFAGDAFVALWRGAPIWDLEQIAALKEERELLREAVHCCVHILCELDEYEVQAAGAATGRLRVHCGVAAGEATFLCLGGAAASQPPTAAGRNELQYTLCGSIVEEMGAATDAAQSGEVYLGAAAAGLLRLGDADGMAPLPDELMWAAARRRAPAALPRRRRRACAPRSLLFAPPRTRRPHRRRAAAAARARRRASVARLSSCRRARPRAVAARRCRRARWCRRRVARCGQVATASAADRAPPSDRRLPRPLRPG